VTFFTLRMTLDIFAVDRQPLWAQEFAHSMGLFSGSVKGLRKRECSSLVRVSQCPIPDVESRLFPIVCCS
jgi:hypothetical protein